MTEKKGSVFGGMLLIVASCTGAGMLGLPILTGLCGFFPSIGLLFVGWFFMTSTGLLLVEANSWFSRQVNLLSLTHHTLGKTGKVLCWVTYLFLFYSILVAYISGTGSLTSTFVETSFAISIPSWVGSLLFVVLFGWIVYLGTRKVDLFNRFLMLGKIGFFVLLVLVGVFYIKPSLLTHVDLSYSAAALPLLVIAFGFQNMIPSLHAYLKGDKKRMRLTIIGGSLCILVILLIWELVVIGTVPLEGENGLIDSFAQGKEASQAISAILPSVGPFAQGLGFFAFLTSFLAQSLALVHFLADGFKISYKKQESVSLCCLALLPPLVFSLIYPQLFFKALNFAGGICAVILFGFLPVFMVWKGRYYKKERVEHQLPGGRPLLLFILLIAFIIFSVQLSSMLGFSFFKA